MTLHFFLSQCNSSRQLNWFKPHALSHRIDREWELWYKWMCGLSEWRDAPGEAHTSRSKPGHSMVVLGTSWLCKRVENQERLTIGVRAELHEKNLVNVLKKWGGVHIVSSDGPCKMNGVMIDMRDPYVFCYFNLDKTFTSLGWVSISHILCCDTTLPRPRQDSR